MISMACNTGEISYNVEGNGMRNFALNALRNGAIGYFGSIYEDWENGVNSNYRDKRIANQVYFSKDQTIGYSVASNILPDTQQTYLGDPTLNIVKDRPGAKGVSTSIYTY